MPTDERCLIDLAADFDEGSGYFGPALGILYGMAIGLDARVMVEVGVNKGGSTRAFLLAAQRTGGRLISIDIADRSDNVPADLHPWWELIIGRSQDVGPRLAATVAPIDLLFLDGEHTYEVATIELATLGARVRSGGLIVMDDCWSMFPGVLDAFNEQPGDEKYLLPYGSPHSVIGGRDRAFGVIRVR